MTVITDDSKQIDFHVDRAFGEPVVLKPMRTQQTGYREAVPDPERIEVLAVGVYDASRGGTEAVGPNIHRQATVDVTLSIRMEPILRCELKKSDRVYFPVRKETYDVTFVHKDYSGRWDVHLVRVLEDVEINPL